MGHKNVGTLGRTIQLFIHYVKKNGCSTVIYHMLAHMIAQLFMGNSVPNINVLCCKLNYVYKKANISLLIICWLYNNVYFQTQFN